MIRAVLFDLYGVLGLNGWQAFKERYFSADPRLWEELRKLGLAVDAGQASYDELVEAIANASGTDVAAVKYSLEHTLPNDELLRFIQTDLTGYKKAIVSNASRDVLPDIFTAEQLSLFDTHVLSVHTGLAKPDTAIFKLACERLGVAPEECVFIDDQERHLATAEKLGMKPVLFTTVAKAEQEIRELLTNG